MFIPFLYNEASILFGKFLVLCEILHFESVGFTKLDLILHIKNSFGPSPTHMHINRAMVIAVKCKAKPIFFKNKSGYAFDSTDHNLSCLRDYFIRDWIDLGSLLGQA